MSCCGARNPSLAVRSQDFDRCHSFLLAVSAPGGARKRPRFGYPRILFSIERASGYKPEALIGLVSYFAAFFARSQSVVKAAGSWIAVSESILRFMSRPASFRPCINVE